MDRRQKKTRQAIFQAFSRLLEIKRFENITVQEIIDEANIGRSTFYAHFETKDELLRAMCTDIFSHVFSTELVREKTHDFSANSDSLKAKLTHLLYHLEDNRKDIVGVLSSESADLFMHYFKQYLSELFAQYAESIQTEAPSDFVLNHLTGSFAEAVKWWISNGMHEPPEQIAEYYISLCK